MLASIGEYPSAKFSIGNQDDESNESCPFTPVFSGLTLNNFDTAETEPLTSVNDRHQFKISTTSTAYTGNDYDDPDDELTRLTSRPASGMPSTGTILAIAGLLTVGGLLIISGLLVIMTETHRIFRYF